MALVQPDRSRGHEYTTSNLIPAPPISVLHEELLRTIFLVNTDFVSEDNLVRHSPLITARRCSQVCRRWRSIILSSSTIWGRVIDVNRLQQRKDDWRKEVFTRTGEAVLWVYGRLDRLGRMWDTFLFTFLQTNWRRVQILVIIDSNHGLDRQKRWAFLKEPAPQLRAIDIEQTFVPSGDSCPFTDDAPLLREYSVTGIGCRFPTNASWLPNLTSVAFSEHYTTEGILTVLQRMPQLVYLAVTTWDETPHRPHLPSGKVILPKLKILEMDNTGTVLKATPILECIAPSSDCCLHTTGYILDGRSQGNEEYEQYENAVRSYVVPYLLLHPPSALNLCITRGSFILADAAFPSSRILDRWWPRHFRIVLKTPSLPSSLLMKELISSPWFSLVSKLELSLQELNHVPYDNQVNVSYIFTLNALSSITTLRTDDETLAQLIQHPQSSIVSSLFPALITLELFPACAMPGVVEANPPHHEFLKMRKAIGRPISVLDLGTLTDGENDMDYLDEHSGLLVRWIAYGGRTCEYVCGQGHQEKLRFESMPNRG
ncbi:hypothetical protein D9613_010865 [Agrocybe pediades]|uniref:F-box domain-containing protein n=1 Tax=Agrocybe pediades TaxID=84607 RepID=A0A8H4QLH7_9AGAR|nr:hypothetical protein D9613_010865 [Agrocybe pediades]